jgi:hypothetical protein
MLILIVEDEAVIVRCHVDCAGGDQHSQHRVTVAGGRPLRGLGAGDSSFPYFFPSHLRPPDSHPEVACRPLWDN